MKTHLAIEKLDYDGSQLKALYGYIHHKVHGDSIIGFIGKCNVSLEHMVDAEDFVVSAKIQSDAMLHFIVEMFGQNLMTAVSLQRLLVSIAQSILNGGLKNSGVSLTRSGDDLYLGEKKLSVSIASVSAVSAMIHLGLNVKNDGTPVPTCSIEDLGVDPKTFALRLMKDFSAEYTSICEATQKVHPL